MFAPASACDPGRACDTLAPIMPSSSARPTAVSDLELVARAASGDERAVAALYDRFGTMLYAVAYRIAGERADAEEVVFEGFAQAWRDAARFESSRGSVAAWLTMIVRSRALDVVRARNRRARAADSAAAAEPYGAPGLGAPGPAPSDPVEHAERAVAVRRALEELPAAQREAIELAYFSGLSQSEIATRLNEPLGTVKTRVRVGMQRLRELLRPYYYEPAP